MNISRSLLAAALVALALFGSACGSGPKSSTNQKDDNYINQLPKTVLAEVGSEKISYGTLEKAFRKNMGRKNVQLWEVEKDSVTDFLDLYVKYRLKVQDAIGRGVNKEPDVIDEIKKNREAVAVPFYYDKHIIDPAVDKILKRREREIKLAVILVGTPQTPGADTTAAYQRITAAMDSLKAGVSFADVAQKFSDDELSRSNGGEIPFSTGGFILREIEDAMFALKPGEIYPEPIRTRVGYFIVKQLKNEPLRLVKVSHILVMYTADRDSAQAEARADSILTLVRKGGDFEQLARELSDDKSSAQNGGALANGFYSRSLGFDAGQGRLVPEFEQAMFALKQGQISDLVQTVYGFHIIKCDSVKPFSKIDGRESVKKRYKSVYFEDDKRAHHDSLRRALGYGWNKSTLTQFLAAVDSNATSNVTGWRDSIGSALGAQVLYRAGRNAPITVAALADSMQSRNDLRGTRLNRSGIEGAVAILSEPMIIAEATADLEKTYPDFGSLMQEFRDGILIFRVENEEVWSKLKFDSTRAMAYYEKEKHRFRTDTLYDISEIYVLHDSTAQNLHQQLLKGASFEELAANNTLRSGFREKQGSWGNVSAAGNTLVQKALSANVGIGEISKPLKFEQGYSIVKIKGRELPRTKTYQEALPDFAAEYQDQVQQELLEKWLSTLKQHYPVDIKTAEIDSIWEQ